MIDESYHVWAYTVQVENLSKHTITLISRYWHITDANGQVEEVRGDGVVGEQPTLQPGEAFQYTSGANLRTHSGIMKGHYDMVTDTEESLTIEVPAFSLDSTEQLARPN